MQINSVSQHGTFGAKLTAEVESQLKQDVIEALRHYPDENHAELFDDIRTIKELYPEGKLYFRTRIDARNFSGIPVFFPKYTLVLSRPGKNDVGIPYPKDAHLKNIPLPAIRDIANELRKIKRYDDSKLNSPDKQVIEDKVKELFA